MVGVSTGAKPEGAPAGPRPGESPGRRTSLRELAAATPEGRDRYVDFLRAFSIGVVVLGHWLIAVIYWRAGEISGTNALDVIPGLWLATWVLQVMPLFFFVGGFSNLVSFDAGARRGGTYTSFIHGRVERLLRPTAVFLLAWIPMSVALDLFTGLSDSVLRPATQLLTRPLWFLGIYLIVIAFAPWMIGIHRRYGVQALGVLAAGAVLVDVAAVGLGLPYAGYVNFALVWLFIHQLGFLYADGTLGRLPRRAHWALAAGGLAGLVLLTGSGAYSPSMVGLAGERSNTNPPTICILVLALSQVGAVMLLRGRMSRWLSRERAWVPVIGANAVIMTMFLWHQTAMLIAVGILYPLGFPQPEAGTVAWWALRPAWVAALAAVLLALVLAFGRFERGRERARRPLGAPADGGGLTVSVVGTAYLVIGILGFAVSGFDGFAAAAGDRLVVFEVNPLANALHLLLGWFLLQSAVVGRSRDAARAAALALGLLGAAGWLLAAEGEAWNVLAANPAASGLRLGTAALLLWPGIRSGTSVESAR